MKILHCSDIHLGKRPFGNEKFSQKRYEDYFKAFGQVVDLAIVEKVEVMIISGDLFDRRDLTPDILGRSEDFFRKLYEE
ncbi:MAG: metallophosphoesterase family protein, partial [Fusobacteriaceae bacterium]